MEMHQVRYFLAVSRTLNFTRAAEECNVAQPSLTKAIKQLEEELGGDLFRRERNHSHLTELGQRMVPMLRQCYESAIAAKETANSIRKGATAVLNLALSRTVNINLLVDPLTQLARAFPGLEFTISRGTALEIMELMKKGDAELAVAGPLGAGWDRIDAWPLFSEGEDLVVAREHPLATRKQVDPKELLSERYLFRPYCELADHTCTLFREHGMADLARHSVSSDSDAIALTAANVGVTLLPPSIPLPEGLTRVAVRGMELMRTINIYAVAGRQRSPAAATLLTLLRARDWSSHLN